MKQLENKVMELNAKLPQLSENLKDVFAKWLWLGAVVSVIVGVLGIMTILGIGAFSNLLFFYSGFGMASMKLWIMIITGVVGMGITLIAEIFAVKPLKSLLYKGWYISFCVVFFQLGFSIVYNFTANSIGSIFNSLVSFAISLYILAQVRGRFTE